MRTTYGAIGVKMAGRGAVEAKSECRHAGQESEAETTVIAYHMWGSHRTWSPLESTAYVSTLIGAILRS